MLWQGRKSAIGIVSMDSANISRLSFRNISIDGSQIATPLFLKLGHRSEGEDHSKHASWPVGSLSDINFTDIRAPHWGHGSQKDADRRGAYTATIEGLPGHRVG